MSIIARLSKVVNVLNIKDLAQLGLYLAEKGVDSGSKAYVKMAEERASMVEIPELSTKEYSISLDEAKRWLKEDGLRVETVVAKPHINYKDCEDLEVVASNYKWRKKVKPGTRIILRYVTNDVIEASQKLFEENERKKELQKAAKKMKKLKKSKNKKDLLKRKK